MNPHTIAASWVHVLDAEGRPMAGFEALANPIESLERTAPWGRDDEPWRYSFDFAALKADDLLRHAITPWNPLASVRDVCFHMPRDEVRVDARGVHVAPQAVEHFVEALGVLGRSCHGPPEARGLVVVAESIEGDLWHHPDGLLEIADPELFADLDEDGADRVWERATAGTLLARSSWAEADDLLDDICGGFESIDGYDAPYLYWCLPADAAARLEDDIARVAARLSEALAEAVARNDDGGLDGRTET